MTFKELQNVSRKVRAAATLETFAPRHVRRTLKEILVLVAPVVIVFGMFFFEESPRALERLYGIVFAFTFFGIILFLIDFFFYSMYFWGIRTILPELGFPRSRLHIPFEVLFIAFHSNPSDVTLGFIKSAQGQAALHKLKIDKNALEQFLSERKFRVKGEQLKLVHEPTLASYAGSIYDADHEFSKFLAGLGLQRMDITNAAESIAHVIEVEKLNLRWWGRDSLGRIRGVGKNWFCHKNYNLEKYGSFLRADRSPSKDSLHIREVSALERILVQNTGSNALIVGEREENALEVVHALGDEIESGTAFPHLEHKRIFLLDENALVKSTGSKTDLKRELSIILHEADKAEHVIFVIKNFSSLISVADSFDLDVMEIFEPHLRSKKLQIIALTDKKSFIKHLEQKIEVMAKFEKILVAW